MPVPPEASEGVRQAYEAMGRIPKSEPVLGSWAEFWGWFYSKRLRWFFAPIRGLAVLLYHVVKSLPGLIKGTVLVVALLAIGMLIASLLLEGTTSIESISVPNELETRGYTSKIAAQRLRDALTQFEDDARQRFLELRKSALREQVPAKDGPISADPLYELDSERTEIIVPSTGLSPYAVADLIRPHVFGWIPGAKKRHHISGEIFVKNGRLWLRLRLDKHEIYSSQAGTDPQNPDDVFVNAVPEVLNATRPDVPLRIESNSLAAIRTAEKIITKGLDPEKPNDLFVQALPKLLDAIRLHILLLAEKDPRQAEEDADAIYARLPPTGRNVAFRYMVKSDIHRQRGEYEMAIQQLKKAIDLAPTESGPHAALGALLSEKSDYPGAIEEFDAALSLNPLNGAVLNDRGNAWAELEDYDRAIGDYTEAIEINPKDNAAFYNRGKAYIAKGEPDHAIADFTAAIAIDPNFALAYNNRGAMHLAKEELEDAISDTTVAIHLNPGLALAYYNRGRANHLKEWYERAISDFTQAIRLDPGDFDTYWSRGIVHHDLSEFEPALADYTEAIRLDPEQTAIRADRGVVNDILGNYSTAVLDLKRAWDGAPDNAYVVLWLYLAQARAGYKAAKKNLNANIAKINQGAWPYPIIELFLEKRNPAAAIAEATTTEQRCEALYYAGQWFLLSGNLTAATTVLETAAKQPCPPRSNEFAAAKAELKRLASRSENGHSVPR